MKISRQNGYFYTMKMNYLNKSFDGILKKSSQKISQKSAEILKFYFSD